MTRFRPLAWRMLATAAGGVIGLVAAITIAAPASAYWTAKTEISSPQVRCEASASEWVVTWKVAAADAPHWVREHELVEIDMEPAGTVKDRPLHRRYPVDQPFTIEQRLAGDTTSVTLSVRSTWHFLWYGEPREMPEWDRSSRTVKFDGLCLKPEPEPTPDQKPEAKPVDASAVSTCTGLIVTLTNPEDGEDTTASVTSAVDGERVGEKQKIPLPVGRAETLASFPAVSDLTVTVTTGQKDHKFRWTPPDCPPPEPGEVEVTATSTCEELTIAFANPRDGIEATAVVAPSVGGPENVAVPIDETVAVAIPGASGLTVDVVLGDRSWVLAWVPRDCAVEVPIGFASDCDSFTIEVTNPQTAGVLEASIVSGDETALISLVPLETRQVVVSTAQARTATVIAADQTVEAEWESPPECDDAAGGGHAVGNTLPSTSIGTTGIIGALGLVAVAGGLLLAYGRGLIRLGRRSPRHVRHASRTGWRRALHKFGEITG